MKASVRTVLMAGFPSFPLLANRSMSMHKRRAHKLPSSVRAFTCASTHMYELPRQPSVVDFRCTCSCDSIKPSNTMRRTPLIKTKCRKGHVHPEQLGAPKKARPPSWCSSMGPCCNTKDSWCHCQDRLAFLAFSRVPRVSVRTSWCPVGSAQNIETHLAAMAMSATEVVTDIEELFHRAEANADADTDTVARLRPRAATVTNLRTAGELAQADASPARSSGQEFEEPRTQRVPGTEKLWVR